MVVPYSYLRIATAQDSDNLTQRVAQARFNAHLAAGDAPAALRVLQMNRYSSADLRCSSELMEDVVSASFGTPKVCGRPIIAPVFACLDPYKTCQLFCIDEAFGFRPSFIAECIREALRASSQQAQYAPYVHSLLPHLWASNAVEVPRDPATAAWHVAAGVVAVALRSEAPGLHRQLGSQPHTCIDLWDGALNERIASIHPIRALSDLFECLDSHVLAAFCLSSDANFLAVVVLHSVSKEQMLAIFRVHDGKVIYTKFLKFEKLIRKIIWCLDSRVVVLCSDVPEPREVAVADSLPSPGGRERAGTDGGYGPTQSNTEPSEPPSGWAAHRDRFLSALGLAPSSPAQPPQSSTTAEGCTTAENNTRVSSDGSVYEDPFVKACISSSQMYFVDWEPSCTSIDIPSAVPMAPPEQTVGHADGMEAKDDSPPMSSPATLGDLSVDEHRIDFFLSDVHTVRDVILRIIPTRTDSTKSSYSVPHSDNWVVLSAQIWLQTRRKSDIIGIVDFEDWSEELQSVQRSVAAAVLNAFTGGDFSSLSFQPQNFVTSGCRTDEYSCLVYIMSQLLQSFRSNYIVAIMCSLIQRGLADCESFLRINKDSVSGYETPPDAYMAETVRMIRSLCRDSTFDVNLQDHQIKHEHLLFVDSHSLMCLDNWQLDLLADFPSAYGEIDAGLLYIIDSYWDSYGSEFIIPKPECMAFPQLVQLFVLEPLQQISAATNLIEDRRLHLFCPLFERDSHAQRSGALLDEFDIPSRIDNLSMSQDSISIGADSLSMIETCSLDRSMDFESISPGTKVQHSVVNFCASLCRFAIDREFHVTVLTDSLKSSGFVNFVAEFESISHISKLNIDSNTKFDVEPVLRAILESARGVVSDSEYLACLSYIRMSGAAPQTLRKFWKYLTTNATVSISDFSIRDFETDLFYSIMSECFRSSTPCSKYKVGHFLF
jgi:hypothetical protein